MTAPNARITPPANRRLAWRLYARHWREILFFSACVAAGVAFLFSIDHLIAMIRRAVAVSAREIMAADVEVSSSRPFGAEALAAFARLADEGVRGTDVASFAAMLETPGDSPFLVTVEAVEPDYPFYGRLTVDPANWRTAMWGKGPARGARASALVESSIALQHGLRAGSRLRLGALRLRAAGVLVKDPARAAAGLSVAPHVLIPLALARRTGLIQFGSRVRYRKLLALPPGRDPAKAAAALKRRLDSELDDPYFRVESYDEAERNLNEALERVTTFFVLISLVGLVLGSIGMAASVAIFINGQLEPASILRCLGLAPGDVRRVYGSLCLAIGVQGGILGAAAGWALSRLSLAVVRRVVGLQLEVADAVDVEGLLQALAVACALAVGVNYGKVRALAAAPPLDAFRERNRGLPASRAFDAAVLLGGLAAVVGYARLKSGSWPVARDFGLSLAGAAIAISALIAAALAGTSAGLARVGRRLPFALRHGLLQLTRQRARTVVFLSTLSAGFALLGALAVVHRSLAKEILLGKAADVPGIFLIDVQKSQVAAVEALAERYSSQGAEFAPLIHARLTEVNGVAVVRREAEAASPEARSRRRMLTREYNLTYKDALHPSERVTAGAFWRPGEAAPQISLEEGFAKRSGLKLGDRLRFDVQGRPLEAPVTSLRSVEWTSMRPNFFVVMPVKALEPAPQTFIASLNIRGDAEAARFRSELLKDFPNVSAVDVTKILDTVSSILDTVLRMLRVLAWFCVAVGLLVLGGTLTLGQEERRETAALFRALGCGRADLVRIDACEFAAVGMLTFAIACLTAYGLGWAVSRRMDIRFAWEPSSVAALLGSALVLPSCVGLAVNWKAYGGAVLESLRRES